MPLSEHEQRLLDQIERALYAEDPKFASTVRGGRFRRPSRRRRLQGAVVLALGLVLLVLGVVIPVRPAGIPVVSVVGFLVMFAGGMIIMFSMRSGAQDTASKATDSGGGSSGSPGRKASRSSFTQRMEDRFRRRFDQ